MTIVPETRVGKIQFYETHLEAWGDDPPSIGVTPAAVAALAGLVAEARDAYDAHRQAQDAARSATQRFHDAVRRMHAGSNGGATLIQQIKTFAQTTGDAGVFSRALIPPPAPPGRPGSAPPPGRPYAFAVTLRPDGAVELTWKCDNPDGAAGTIYQVKRQVGEGGAGGPGAWAVVGTVGAKAFIDRTLPPGTAQCTYEVTALRSTAKGEPTRYVLQFGGGGGADAFVLQAGSVRLVA